MKRVAIDMDEVLADTLAEHIARYNRDHGEAITKADLEGKWLWDIVSIESARAAGGVSALGGFLRGPAGDRGQSARAAGDGRAVRGLHRNVGDGVSEFLWAEVSVAAAALPFSRSAAFCVLRGQEHFEGGLPDRRSAAESAGVCGERDSVYRSAQSECERVYAGG